MGCSLKAAHRKTLLSVINLIPSGLLSSRAHFRFDRPTKGAMPKSTLHHSQK